jgi:hypothetical protein
VVDKYGEMAPKVGMDFDCEEKPYSLCPKKNVIL